ncbi:alcohol oxidase [Sistotremastrum suecicum HHB10207 ss-3]|uniref:Alcohol oxidase n=1 Tax=Sistotremastrum suecicum HHB10207 ss-3 TaxID=1314776 RepID=A0A166AFS5_9AGAM|nr:alcohol oxidase [Sistotremastrum suecicum HHB10207 ss-3]
MPHHSNPESFTQLTYDYIVIGGGSTGLVVAARLAEDPSVQVGIIEAGPYHKDDPRVTIPGYFGKTLGDPSFDWMFESTPQTHLDNRILPLARGRTLGGTSTINSMTWARASKADYAALVELGNKGWSWEDWLPYFLRSESMPEAYVKGSREEKEDLAAYDANEGVHSSEGRVKLGYVPWFGDTHRPFFRALEGLGVPSNPSSGSGANTGNFTLVTSIDPKSATRSNATSAYYEPSSQSSNLHLITGAHVTRILLDGPERSEGNVGGKGEARAVGVEFEFGDAKKGEEGERKEGKKWVVGVKRDGEVVLSGGSYMSPVILEQSGIGSPSLLKSLGITPLVDLPGVGENLQDHPLVPMSYELKDSKTITGDLLRDPAFAAKELEYYQKTRKGQYASIHSAFSLLPLQHLMRPPQISAVARSIDPVKLSGGKGGGKGKRYEIQRRWIEDPHHANIELMHVPEYCTFGAGPPKKDGRYVSILVVLMHALSKGSVHASSSKSRSKPIINPAFLSHPSDLTMLTHGLRFAHRVAQSSPLGDLISTPSHPTSQELDPHSSSKGLEGYIKKLVESGHHPIGSCSMLPRKDGGVVDERLKVYGTCNIRVVDASILPIHFSAHPQATLYALGEKVGQGGIRGVAEEDDEVQKEGLEEKIDEHRQGSACGRM